MNAIESIVQEVRQDRGYAWEDVPPLVGEAHRLRVGLEVANRWLEAADDEGSDVLGARSVSARHDRAGARPSALRDGSPQEAAPSFARADAPGPRGQEAD